MKLLGWVTRERMVDGRHAPSVLDWFVALALAIVALLELESGVFPGPVAIAAAIQLAAILPVAFRRVAPLAAIAITASVFLPYVVLYGYGFAGGSVANAATELLLVYSVGRHTQGRRLLAGAALALLMAAEPGIAGRASPSDWAANLIVAGGALALGVALRVQVGRSIALAVAADRTQRDQDATALSAVHEERARIASELQDVVAHNVGLIVLQAGGARSVLATDPDRARAALRQVEETGRQTLAEMRHLVGILRLDDGADPQSPPRLEHLPTSAAGMSMRHVPSVLDWLAALALAIIAFIEMASGVFPGPVAVLAAVQLAVALPVAFRRVAPLAAIAASATAFLAYTVIYGRDNSVAHLVTGLLLSYSVGRHTEGRRLLAGAAVVLMITAELLVGAGLLFSLGDWAYLLILFGGALVLGVALRVQVQRSITLAIAADRAQRDQEATAQAAVHEERARIARELHDVVADKVGLIVLQAGGARSVLATDPDRARTALLQVEETGRQTLAEMRQLVGILRVDEGEERQPLPRLERLPALVDETRAAGLAVDLAVEGPVVGLSAGLELAVYRLIQEALTNVRKHAPGSRVQASLRYEPERLRIEVTDDGGASGTVRDTVMASGLGHGLIGMRERVQLYGGRMEAGPISGGGFRVQATLPLSVEAA
jgi:signal transduction histidine kinase